MKEGIFSWKIDCWKLMKSIIQERIRFPPILFGTLVIPFYFEPLVYFLISKPKEEIYLSNKQFFGPTTNIYLKRFYSNGVKVNPLVPSMLQRLIWVLTLLWEHVTNYPIYGVWPYLRERGVRKDNFKYPLYFRYDSKFRNKTKFAKKNIAPPTQNSWVTTWWPLKTRRNYKMRTNSFCVRIWIFSSL